MIKQFSGVHQQLTASSLAVESYSWLPADQLTWLRSTADLSAADMSSALPARPVEMISLRSRLHSVVCCLASDRLHYCSFSRSERYFQLPQCSPQMLSLLYRRLRWCLTVLFMILRVNKNVVNDSSKCFCFRGLIYYYLHYGLCSIFHFV